MTDLVAPVCWPCVVALHEECYDPRVLSDDDPELLTCCCQDREDDPYTIIEVPGQGVGRPAKDPGDITDATSTGRKRAVTAAPIFDGMLCEWAWLANAGGGIEPIVGCAGNRLKASKSGTDKGERHHGPDKNVLNNTHEVNLHAICTWCHHAWHSANDTYYATPRPEAGVQWLPEENHGRPKRHDPETLATEDQVREAYEARGWTYPQDRVYPLH